MKQTYQGKTSDRKRPERAKKIKKVLEGPCQCHLKYNFLTNMSSMKITEVNAIESKRGFETASQLHKEPGKHEARV